MKVAPTSCDTVYVYIYIIGVYQVADTDIGWTLGYMLNLTNLIPSELPLVVMGVQHSQWAAEVFFIVFAVFLSLIVLVLLWLWSPQDGRGNK